MQVPNGKEKKETRERKERKSKSFVGFEMKEKEAAEEVPSSRLCVKNIPKYATEARVKGFFGKLEGVRITDAKVLKTPDGRPRQIAFVGFRNEEDATKAKNYFNKAYFDTCKMSITFALPYGDQRLAKGWSKHSKTPNAAGQKRGRDGIEAEEEAEVKKKVNDGSKSKLAEFLSVMQPRSQSKFWSNDDENTVAAAALEEEESESSDEEMNEEVSGKEETEGQDSAESDEKRSGKEAPGLDVAEDTGRLFIRNLPFTASEDDLHNLFSKFGPVTESHIPLDEANRSKGFGYISFMIPEHAIRAISEVDGTIFQGRLLHILPAFGKPDEDEKGTGSSKNGASTYKAKKEAERREKAGDTRSWNALFIRGEAAVESVAQQLGVGKSDLLLGEAGNDSDDEGRKKGPSAAVRMALAETRVIAETKKFLADEGVDLELLEKGVRDPSSVPRSKTCLLVKNLPATSEVTQLRQMFAAFGQISSFVMPPSKTMALVSFFTQKDTKRAFRGLAYRRYKEVPIYLEYAPENVVRASEAKASEPVEDSSKEIVGTVPEPASSGSASNVVSDLRTLFVKNLNFDTEDATLQKFFVDKVGKNSVVSVTIPRRKSPTGVLLSSGYGFVEFSSGEMCKKALRLGRGGTLDGHILELKISERKVDMSTVQETSRKKSANEELASSKAKAGEKSTKIIIRNIPFEATKKEIMELVSAYGQINSVRLPKKFDGSLRGFAFVDFVTHQEAKNAFAALSSSHFYGRHMVIEWANESDSLETLREKASKQLNRI